MSEEELDEVREELAAARVEIERLQTKVADREARAVHLESEVTQLREELTQARDETQTREQELTAQAERGQELEAQAREAAERYRELVLQQSPELPAELVAGDTVQQVDASLERARETVSKVRGHLESQAQAGRVPVGAPPRSGPDLSALSPEEKISYGLRRRSV